MIMITTLSVHDVRLPGFGDPKRNQSIEDYVFEILSKCVDVRLSWFNTKKRRKVDSKSLAHMIGFDRIGSGPNGDRSMLSILAEGNQKPEAYWVLAMLSIRDNKDSDFFLRFTIKKPSVEVMKRINNLMDRTVEWGNPRSASLLGRWRPETGDMVLAGYRTFIADPYGTALMRETEIAAHPFAHGVIFELPVAPDDSRDEELRPAWVTFNRLVMDRVPRHYFIDEDED